MAILYNTFLAKNLSVMYMSIAQWLSHWLFVTVFVTFYCVAYNASQKVSLEEYKHFYIAGNVFETLTTYHMFFMWLSDFLF